jgi:hypothetical protein
VGQLAGLVDLVDLVDFPMSMQVIKFLALGILSDGDLICGDSLKLLTLWEFIKTSNIMGIH